MDHGEGEENFITAVLENKRTREIGLALFAASRLLLFQFPDNARYLHAQAVLGQFGHQFLLLPAASAGSELAAALAGVGTVTFLPRRLFSEPQGLAQMQRVCIGATSAALSQLAATPLATAAAAAALAHAGATSGTPPAPHSARLETPHTGQSLVIDPALMFGMGLLGRRAARPGAVPVPGLADLLSAHAVTRAGRRMVRSSLAVPPCDTDTVMLRQGAARALAEPGSGTELRERLRAALRPHGALDAALLRVFNVAGHGGVERMAALTAASASAPASALGCFSAELAASAAAAEALEAAPGPLPSLLAKLGPALSRATAPAAALVAPHVADAAAVPPLPVVVGAGAGSLRTELAGLFGLTSHADAALNCAQRAALAALGQAGEAADAASAHLPAAGIELAYAPGRGLHLAGSATGDVWAAAAAHLREFAPDGRPGTRAGQARRAPSSRRRRFTGTTQSLQRAGTAFTAALADGALAGRTRLSAVVADLRPMAASLCALSDALALLDLVQAWASYAASLEERGVAWCWPRLADGPLGLAQLTPPLLEASSRPPTPLPSTNTVLIEPRRPNLVIVGENATGKSALLASVVHAAALAHAGGPLPAADATLPPLRYLRGTGAGADGRAGGAAEDAAVLAAVAAGAPGTLAVLDEPLRAAPGPEAAACVWAAVESAPQGVLTLTATHVAPLAAAAAADPRCAVSHFAPRAVAPFSLRPGLAGAEPGYGLRLVAQLGAPRAFSAHAGRVLATLTAAQRTGRGRGSTIGRLRQAAASDCSDAEFAALFAAMRTEMAVHTPATSAQPAPAATPATARTPAAPRLQQQQPANTPADLYL